MPVKERTDYKTEEVRYNEYYCDRCDGLIGKDIEEDEHRVVFGGYDDALWCHDCFKVYVDKKRFHLQKVINFMNEHDTGFTFGGVTSILGMSWIFWTLSLILLNPLIESLFFGLLFGAITTLFIILIIGMFTQ